ncbi:FmdB family zinc ribbon protein [Microbacterium karelineae]|uniref:FmdB family zinc ribbon protein n=1 Tax=Microbacterium karelineae TaxID=2654283 RepID=UPI0012EA98E1|nr:FmdB family zinc ribbon protein [Microbacterium karelineae]
MPTYAYACTDCGHAFDAVQSFSEASLTDCPSCDGRLRKQYGSIGVTFNGSGFYRTDSRATTSSSASTGGSSSDGASSSSATPSPATAGAASSGD